MAEQYVRPALLARELPSGSAAKWRFRLGAFLLLAILAGVVIFVFYKVSGLGAEDPGLGGALHVARHLLR